MKLEPSHLKAVPIDESAVALDAIQEIGMSRPERAGWAVLAAASLLAGHIEPEQAIAAAAGN